ncbi:lytic murein transglycosylase B [Gilvimarinus polysaccharolyticus]|uniref:lytic murein transglycosylase B n=1 Tax=Gilvimarinus polysaccharolyticus TaxID=863921 RepID=UPI001E42F7B6|nr:lytic murein transglycosylase B [Gilvimarinus polysaccharolyticus]
MFIDRMVTEHQFSRESLQALFYHANKRQTILDAISRPAEKTKSWADYRNIFIKDARIKSGVKFWLDNADALARAEQEFGVPAEYIVAIIGVETLYGRVTGSYRVIDALSTLAFDYPPRSDFFTRELEQYLLLTREHQQDPLSHKGSYAGAMGYGQFMPSSYRHYAVDFDGDDLPDIWNNLPDAIGSVANYFKSHGWQPGKQVVLRARPEDTLDSTIVYNQIVPPEHSIGGWMKAGLKPISAVPSETLALAIKLDGALGDEYWLGFNNFYVITRYNRSHMYAMAVHQLAQAIVLGYQADGRDHE